MSDNNSLEKMSNNSDQTEGLAFAIGSNLKGGEVIELCGDLGSGKTTFVRGLTRGVGSKDHVASPTFTLSRIYSSGRLKLHHLDFYRLADGDDIKHEIVDLLGDKNNVIVIEWAEISHPVLPDRRLIIKIEHAQGNQRKLTFSLPKNLKYLIEGMS